MWMIFFSLWFASRTCTQLKKSINEMSSKKKSGENNFSMSHGAILIESVFVFLTCMTKIQKRCPLAVDHHVYPMIKLDKSRTGNPFRVGVDCRWEGDGTNQPNQWTLMIDRERDENDFMIITNVRTVVKSMSCQRSLKKRHDPHWSVNRCAIVFFMMSLQSVYVWCNFCMKHVGCSYLHLKRVSIGNTETCINVVFLLIGTRIYHWITTSFMKTRRYNPEELWLSNRDDCYFPQCLLSWTRITFWEEEEKTEKLQFRHAV